MNKSSSYSMLSIIVISKTPGTVTYSLAHGMRGRSFSWSATSGSDRMIIDSLEVGAQYFVRVAPDQSGTQHWIEAKKVVDQRTQKPADDAITQAAAKRKARPQVNEDLLLF